MVSKLKSNIISLVKGMGNLAVTSLIIVIINLSLHIDRLQRITLSFIVLLLPSMSFCGPHESLGLIEEDTQWLLLWSHPLKVAVIFHSIYQIKLHAMVIGERHLFILSWKCIKGHFFTLILYLNVYQLFFSLY